MADRSISFVIPRLPASMNSLYQILFHQRRVELKPEHRRWKNEAKDYIPRFDVTEGATLRIDCVLNFDWSKRRFDSANLLKLVLDAICERLGVNDKAVRHGSWYSIDSEKEFLSVTITEVESGG